jgi:energy-coupling factor transporter ATP-binding protein EcfA2
MYSSISPLRKDVRKRLRRGEHLVLYGPVGSGKSVLLNDLATQLSNAGLPCALVNLTQSLEDITGALKRTYSSVDPTQESPPVRELDLEQIHGGVLLLDHLIDLTDSMIHFLRRCRGGILGVLAAVDTEVELESERLRPSRLGALVVRMPPFSPSSLRELLHAQCIEHDLPLADSDAEARLLAAARGRPGWIHKCIELQKKGAYRQGEQLFVSALCEDTEAALHEIALTMLRVNHTPAPSDASGL